MRRNFAHRITPRDADARWARVLAEKRWSADLQLLRNFERAQYLTDRDPTKRVMRELLPMKLRLSAAGAYWRSLK